MTVSAGQLTIRLLRLPTRDQLIAAHDAEPQPDRLLTVVRLETDDGAVGWGECSALNRPTYSPEWAEGVFDALVRGSVDSSAMPMAAAAVEMARLDAQLKVAGVSLAEWIGTDQSSVVAGAVIGLVPMHRISYAAAELLDAGYRRLKIKIRPGDAAQRVDVLRREHGPGFELQADANGSFDQEGKPELVAAVAAGLNVLEQPFGPAERAASAQLTRELQIPVLADEDVSTLADVQRLIAEQACSGLVVKPARLGGISSAVTAVKWCKQAGLQCSPGGMLESGLGRHALAAVAALPGMTITGDVSPAGRWLQDDPWPDLQMTRGRILVPTGPGVSPAPEQDLLDRFTIRQHQRRMH